MIFRDLDDTQRLYRLRHWMRDGGARYVFDSMFWATTMAVVLGFITIMFVVMFIRTSINRPAHHELQVIDHHRDGTAILPERKGLRFNLRETSK